MELEDEVFANSGEDVFEEVFKLIFIKLYDEHESSRDKNIIDHHIQTKNPDGSLDYRSLQELVAGIEDGKKFRQLEFRYRGQPAIDLKNCLNRLFDKAKDTWVGVFESQDTIKLQPEHLVTCVSSLQNVKLFNSNLMVIDEAFEHLISKNSKGVKGQFFTPRHVIDMCVKMLNPKPGEYMIDTAAGSCGFPVHTIFKITGQLFSNRIEDRSSRHNENISRIFGIDFDKAVVRVARTLNLIAGDGETNILELNTLNFPEWQMRAEKDVEWVKRYGKGFDRLVKLRSVKNRNQKFNFDLLMANPPFAGGIEETQIKAQYELAFDKDKKIRPKVERDILFLERNLDFVKPGGRLAIVLPQGRFDNKSDEYIRKFIYERARVVAVVSLNECTFKPHTSTKTSVLFLQKWTEKNGICPKLENYSIFFAVSGKPGKDVSGRYVHAKNRNGINRLDKHGHLIIDHDLHNHDNELESGIAEQFIEWARKIGLSFWSD